MTRIHDHTRLQSHRNNFAPDIPQHGWNRRQEIRDAYYKAVEGLRTLADALELADANQPEPAGPLIDKHLIACEALDAMKHSLLGRIL